MARVASPQWFLLLLLIGARFSRETVAAQQPNWRVRWLPEAVSSMFRVSLASGHGFHPASKARTLGLFKPLRCCLGSVRRLDSPFMRHLLSFLFHRLAFARGFGCGDHFLGDFVWHEVVVRKLHRVAGAPLRHRGQVGGVAEHLGQRRSEEHTSELQSRQYLVCRLLLEKKKK